MSKCTSDPIEAIPSTCVAIALERFCQRCASRKWAVSPADVDKAQAMNVTLAVFQLTS